MSDRIVGALVFLAVMVALAGPVLLQDEPALLTGFHDDAFYYLQIARNLAIGRGFTFDGIHSTNGFHPLWLFVVTPAYSLDIGAVATLRVVGFLESILAAAAVTLIYFTLRARIPAGAAATASLLVIALPGAREALRYGMEGSLLLFLLVVVWNRWLAATEHETASTARWLGLGAACAFAFLARLEAGLIVPLILLCERARLPTRRVTLFCLMGPVAVTIAAYLLWNHLVFDMWLPISGTVKSYQTMLRSDGGFMSAIWEIPWPGHELVCRLWGRPALSLCPPAAQFLHGLLVALAVALCWWWRRVVIDAIKASGIGLPLLVSAGMVLADLALVRFLVPWARVPIILSTALLSGALLHVSPILARRAAVILAVVTAVIQPLRVMGADNPSNHFPIYRALAARWVDDHLPASHRIGSWNAGTFGYFAGRPVVNLDGLVNDRQYFERVIRGSDLEGYLKAERITWVADQVCGPHPTPAGYLERTGSIALEPRFELAASFYNLETPDGCPGYAIWRFNP